VKLAEPPSCSTASTIVFIGRNRRGQWVAQQQNGLYGGLFVNRAQALKSAYDVGTATIDGVETDHYAFREADVDWEVWIQQGDQPLPRKIVIVDRTDPSRPTFTSRLRWQVNPPLTDADFTFVPDANAKQIKLATYKGSGE